MNKKYQVFISSTYKDLKPARLKVSETILSMGHFPVGMEMFGASDDEQWKIIKETIDTSDYYIVIIGKCLGTIVPNEDISYTQKEFRYALEKKIPVIAFIMSDEAKPAKSYKETDPKRIKKLKNFIKELETGRTTDYWISKEDLALKVAISLQKEMYRHPMLGWVRANKIDEIQSNEIINKNLLNISDESITMLFFASEEKGTIEIVDNLNENEYIAGNNPLNKTDDPRELARWESALNELIDKRYVKRINKKHNLYGVTDNGFKKIDLIKDVFKLDSNYTPSQMLSKIKEIKNN